MYKLLIVDDEELEREGMAEFIPWKDYDIELVGTAWNGVEGFEFIQKNKVDIVLTDIKMPVMDGLELISKIKENLLDIEVIVLSGYGEFEFTSKAMGYGIRHYILKPCDESKIVPVLDKVKAEIAEKNKRKKKENEYVWTVKKLLPRAREQVFCNMLLEREQLKADYDMFMEEVGSQDLKVELFAFRKKDTGFDYLEQFVIENVLKELVGEKNVLLSASIGEDVLFLIKSETVAELEVAVSRIRQEFKQIGNGFMQAAVSKEGKLENAGRLYGQIKELFRMGKLEQRSNLLHHGLFQEKQKNVSSIFDYAKIKDAKDYGDILFEVYLAFMKMNFVKYDLKIKKDLSDWVLRLLCDEKILEIRSVDWNNSLCEWEAIIQLADVLAEQQNCSMSENKDQERMKIILNSIYQELQNPELSIKYLSKEVLFMNEDYFGRLFQKSKGKKFSTFLLETRIELAQRLLQYNTDIKIANLAEWVGYPVDGQYFSKAFHKLIGMTPTEYRDKIKENSDYKKKVS